MRIAELLAPKPTTDPQAIAIKAREKKLKADKKSVKVQKAQLRLRKAQQVLQQARAS